MVKRGLGLGFETVSLGKGSDLLSGCFDFLFSWAEKQLRGRSSYRGRGTWLWGGCSLRGLAAGVTRGWATHTAKGYVPAKDASTAASGSASRPDVALALRPGGEGGGGAAAAPLLTTLCSCAPDWGG